VSVEDAPKLKAAWPAIGWISPRLYETLPVQTGRVRLAGVGVNAVMPEYQEIGNHRVSEGRFFDEEEVRDHARVAVLKESLAQDLFGTDSAVGREILLGNLRMTVVGVVARRASFDEFRQLYVPLTTGAAELGISARNCRLWLKLREEIAPADAMPALLDLLSKLHPGSTPEQYFVISLGKFQQRILDSVEKLARSLLGVAFLTLLTGGAGVMNVLLISAAERTREIGLKKALGARRQDIAVQMLLEATLLCVVGGAAGLAGSAVVGKAAVAILRKGAEPGFVTPLPFHVTSSMGIVSLLCVAAVTMTFGAFPAWRASRLEPAEALRR
jgi:ABC-type antimicrobial peptide transport system permease subunit